VEHVHGEVPPDQVELLHEHVPPDQVEQEIPLASSMRDNLEHPTYPTHLKDPKYSILFT
jgi:hypothetical protein